MLTPSLCSSGLRQRTLLEYNLRANSLPFANYKSYQNHTNTKLGIQARILSTGSASFTSAFSYMPETAAGGKSLFLKEEVAIMHLTWQIALEVGLIMEKVKSCAFSGI